MNAHSTQRPARPALTPAAMLAKSATGVALIVGIAWIGVVSIGAGEATTDPSVDEAGAAAGVVIRGDRAAAHRQQVFEERRARFEQRTPTQIAGDATVERPAP